MNTKIQTYSGKILDFADPKPEMFCIQDIAVGLAHTCRFSGQTGRFYSVAQHSIMCVDLVADKYKLQALLHDASEAYMSDIVKPLKNLLPDYQATEDKMMQAIATRFGFDYPLSRQVKEADAIMLCTEMEHLVNNREQGNGLILMQSDEAFREFMKLYMSLTNGPA